MLIPANIKIYFYLNPTDMRKSIDSLCILIADVLAMNPASGHLFLFRSRKGNKIKALHYEPNCFTLWYRRLEKGKFIFPKNHDGHIEMSTDHFQWLLASDKFSKLEVMDSNFENFTRSSLCAWILKTAELCAPLVRCLQQEIVQHDYTQADETTLQVLEEVGRDNTNKSFMWVYYGGDLIKPSIVFEYQETRGGYHPQIFLHGFKGYLQTDAYSGYHWVEKRNDIYGVGCMAHARRPFAECAKLSKKPGLATQALTYFRKLYAIEKEARENHLRPEQRYDLRQKQALTILHEFKTWLEEQVTKVAPQQKLGQAIHYSLRQWELLTGYLEEEYRQLLPQFIQF